METLARQIEQGMHGKEWRHSAIYEKDLARLWPLNEKDREAKIEQFATQYGFRLRFYSKGMCAIFDKSPPPNGQMMDSPGNSKSVIRVYDEAGNVIETQAHAGELKEW